MKALRIASLADDKPVKLTVELSAQVHRDLQAYADIIAKTSGQPTDPAKLVSPMLARFMASDRAFVKAKQQ
jgi:hypothetical protein